MPTLNGITVVIGSLALLSATCHACTGQDADALTNSYYTKLKTQLHVPSHTEIVSLSTIFSNRIVHLLERARRAEDAWKKDQIAKKENWFIDGDSIFLSYVDGFSSITRRPFNKQKMQQVVTVVLSFPGEKDSTWSETVEFVIEKGKCVINDVRLDHGELLTRNLERVIAEYGGR